jgi:methylglutaconyl-CoA hydratase
VVAEDEVADNDRTTIRVERDERGVATVTMDRPEVHNAMNTAVIEELRQVFDDLGQDPDVRVVVLTGAGRSFSAGADLHWMRGMVDNSFEENVEDSRGLDRMLLAIQRCPKPVVARVNGACLGGGVGLVAACDIAVAVRGATFGFTEVRLGLAPAVISTYVLPKIGPARARSLFLTGDRFGGDDAERIGLIQRSVGADELDGAVEGIARSLLAGGPAAIAAVKELLLDLPDIADPAARRDRTVRLIAHLRVSDEGQEGMSAFFEKREPAWRDERPRPDL